MPRECQAQTLAGHQCGAAPLIGGLFCFSHDPDSTAEAAEARKLGGYRRKRESTIGVAYELENLATVSGIRRVLEIVVVDLLAQDPGIARSRQLIAAARVLADLYERGELAARLETVEAALLDRRREPTPPGGLLGTGLDEELTR